MRKTKEHFLEILKIELKDLKEDLKLLIKECQRRKECGLITDHVYLANMTLFKNELLGLDDFVQICKKTKPGQFETLTDMVNALRKAFEERIKEEGIARAIFICVDRKLTKVMRYVSQ